MAPAAKKQLALDANVLLDLADQNPGILSFHRAFLRRGYELWVAPPAHPVRLFEALR
jgi:hypothetical protein